MAAPSPPHLRQQYAAPPPQHVASRPSDGGFKAGPPAKSWSDEEGVAAGKHGHSFCTRFKFSIWLFTVFLLIAAAVGLSVTMAIVMDNRNSSSGGSGGGGTNGGSTDDTGGDGSGGDGNTGALPVPPYEPDWVPAGQRALWWDDFDGTQLDRSKWSLDLGTGDWGWGNNELQTYTDSGDNVRVADGNLYITAQSDNGQYTSARINTKPTAGFYPSMQLQDGTAFKKVHIEARMQLPDPGQGLWPAFWLFPTELYYGKWAASGEIDVLESVNDMKRITQGLHYGGADPANQKTMVKTQQDSKDAWSYDWHTFAVDWEAGKISVSIDGRTTKTFLPREKDPETGWYTDAANAAGPNSPFDRPFYIILNLAVGGQWPKPPDATTPFPSTLTVDYVRAWGTPL